MACAAKATNPQKAENCTRPSRIEDTDLKSEFWFIMRASTGALNITSTKHVDHKALVVYFIWWYRQKTFENLPEIMYPDYI